jgi:beta-N-acetylhexosaminidase
MVYGFPGTAPPADLVRRIRRGEAGAVILLGPNVPSRAAARALTRRLQAIPRPAAVDVPLLVMIDQEGGLVRRLDGPPTRSAAEMGRQGPRAARAAGRATGRFLARAGVNVDLAPVADVARTGSFLEATGRTFGRAPGRVAGAAVAFAAGLRDAGVAATAKHFPGLGTATRSTDEAPARLTVGAAVLRRVDLRPFRALVAHDVPLVMLGTATYPALDRARPAALSRRVATGLLRGELGFRGVTVTDALDTPALAPSGGTGAVAVRAAGAGSDMLLHTGYGAGTASAAALARAVRTGALPRAEAEAAVSRILALRSRLR